ncbi:Uncharacterised protein [Serratia fonticola]|uniref:Uncharacterized protein n=1 Tax=Serratia fonticola TaxID=47917 RepID=A0A4U9VY58_SERFO|nr:Uncharacterised protein [Serratia fonticola]
MIREMQDCPITTEISTTFGVETWSEKHDKEKNHSPKKAFGYNMHYLMYCNNWPPPVTNHTLPPEKSWPSTRQLAMAIDIGIYRARYLLLDMVNKNYIVVSDSAINNSLRWFPIGSNTPKPFSAPNYRQTP